MLEDNSLQIKKQKIYTQNDTSKTKSAFSFVGCTQLGLKNQGKRNTLNLDEIIFRPSKQLLSSKAERHVSYNGEIWYPVEIEKLFKLYDCYGPQWKVMSLQMPSRTANNLKNRFYTVLRNLIKLLFRKKQDTCPKLPGQIPSKDLSRLYEGKQNYEEFACLIPTLLQQLGYNLASQNIDAVVEEYGDDIIRIYHKIYGQRVLTVQDQNKSCLKKSVEVSTCYIPSSIFLQKTEENQKINQQSLTINNGDNLNKNVSQPWQDFYYFFYFNPEGIYMPQVI